MAWIKYRIRKISYRIKIIQYNNRIGAKARICEVAGVSRGLVPRSPDGGGGGGGGVWK